MTYFRNLSLLLATTLPLALAPACTSDNTSTAGQMISCTQTGSGTTDCHPVSSDPGTPGTCVDIDEDGDGQDHDVEEADDQASVTGDTDDDHDGTSDAEDPDDDNDGIPDDRDCDEGHGGDDDDSGDVPLPPPGP
jgi:hypothetical protein